MKRISELQDQVMSPSVKQRIIDVLNAKAAGWDVNKFKDTQETS